MANALLPYFKLEVVEYFNKGLRERSALTADNFEKLVFNNGTLHLLSRKNWLSRLSAVVEGHEEH
jgi:hypothetical protein